MADFSIEIPVGMDISQVNAALKKFNGDIQQTSKYLTELNQSITGESRQIGVQFVAKDSASPAFKAVETSANKSGKAFQSNERQLKQLTKTYDGSVTSLRQGLAARKQELAGLRKTDTRYKHVTQQIEGYQRALNKAKGIQEGSITQLRQQQQKFQDLADTLALGSAEQIKYANAAKQIENQIKRTTNPLGQFFAVLNRIATLQAGFTAFAAIIGTFSGSLNKFVGQLKALEGFELALKNVGLSTAEVNERLQDATRISAQLGAPLEQVEKSFKRMVPALEAVGVNAEDSSRFLEGVAARTQTLGLNTEQTGRFMEAFAQVLSKGKLQSEELNQQISELDGAFRGQLAKSLDVTTQELEEMIKNGEITSTVFVKAFNNMANGAEALKRRIEEGNATIQQLQNLIDLLDTTNLRRIGAAIEPGIKAFLQIQFAVSEFIETLSKSEIGAFLATVFNEIAKGARDFVKVLTELTKAIVFLIQPLAAFTNQFGFLLRAVTFAGLAFLTFKAQAAIGTLLASLTSGMTFLSAAALKLAAALGTLSAMNTQSFLLTVAGAVVKLKTVLVPLLLKFAPLIAALALASSAFNFFKGSMDKINKPAKDFTNEVGEIINKLKSLPSATKEAAKNVDILFSRTGKTEKDFIFGGANLARSVLTFKEANEAIKTSDKLVEEVTKASKQYNEQLQRQGILTKENKAASNGRFDIENSELATNIAINEEKVKLMDRVIQQEMERKNALIGNSAETENARKIIEKNIETLTNERNAIDAIGQALKKDAAARKENGEQIERQISSFKDLQNIQKQQAKVNELVNKQLDSHFMERFGDSAATASEKLILLTSAQHELNEATRKGIEEQLRAIKARKTSPTGFTEEDKRQSIELLSGQLLDAEKAVKESSDRLNKAIQDDLKRTLDDITAVADSYTELANAISQASSKLASSTTGALGDFRSLLDAVTERETEFASPQQKRNIEDNRLRMLAKINRIEDLIARSRLTTEFKIAQLQNQQLQSKLRAEQTLAINRGDVEGAKRLEEQIGLSQQIGQEQRKVFGMELLRLDIQKRLKDELLLQEAVSKGMFNQYQRGRHQQTMIRRELGLQKTTSEDLDRILDKIVRKGSKQIFRMDKSAIREQTKGLEKQSTSVDEMNKRMKHLKEQNAKIVESGKLLGTAFKNVKNLLSSTTSEAGKFRGIMGDTLAYIEKMLQLLGGGTEARFMGGPVEAGQTYRVNDAGLGREAFMNKFGDVKMLPAASNMNWTAPSSGTIIPAKVVKAMQKNADINANITAKQTRQTPNISNIASSAASGVSGSLAKQLGSAVSGSTSNRITNNVTIQSQSPVNDASDLMTNVARMRLRNSRRI